MIIQKFKKENLELLNSSPWILLIHQLYGDPRFSLFYAELVFPGALRLLPVAREP